MDNKSVDSFRTPYENDNEWSLRKKFLENNASKFRTDRLVCLSMCYINNVSYGVTYTPGVMSQLKELSQGLVSHMDIVKEKNSVAFVKAKQESSSGCKYGNFIKSSEASYEKTFHEPGVGFGGGAGGTGLGSGTGPVADQGFRPPGGAGLGFKAESTDNSTDNNSGTTNSTKYPGFAKSGSSESESENSRPCFSTTKDSATNRLSYPGFVKSGSAASENSKSCFSTTENVTNMFDYPGCPKSGPNNPAAENPNASPNNNNNDKYMKMMKPSPNAYTGSQDNMLSSKYRSKHVLKGAQDSPRPQISTPPPAKRTLITPPEASATNSTSSYRGASGASEVAYLEKKFYVLADCLKEMKFDMNSIQTLTMAIHRVKLLINDVIMPSGANKKNHSFRCKVRVADVQVGEGSGPTKKAAKHKAYNRALDVCSKSNLKIEEGPDGRLVLVGSDRPRPQQQGRMSWLKPAGAPAGPNTAIPQRKRPMSSWGHFLIMENKAMNNAVAVIRRSVEFNKMSVQYVYKPVPLGSTCQLLINDEPIMDCEGETKTVAKLTAAEKTLVWLKERCWTILIKQSADSDDIDITRDNIMGEIEKQFKPIGSDNIGNQLLRKMGWEGGGIGAEGNKGIDEPITVNQVIDRQGLGCRSTSGVSSKFDTQIRDILLRYVKSKNQQDLVFTSEFNKDERAIIHKEARRYNLKTVSRGGGEKRYMIISRKRSAGQLFNHILSSGGSTQKYDLVPPLNMKT